MVVNGTYRRLIRPPRQSFFLLGVRGAGKSTWARRQFPDAPRIDLLRTTVHGYLDILEDTLLAYRLPAFEAKLRVRERRHPKLYWVDPGLVRAIKKRRGSIAPEERGALLEGWVLHCPTRPRRPARRQSGRATRTPSRSRNVPLRGRESVKFSH